eukprot:COSAG06_NODE_36931_length_441_cov_1.011696_1_plen_26_part_01
MCAVWQSCNETLFGLQGSGVLREFFY